jgi:polar amino acid transport system substrate-binding protein
MKKKIPVALTAFSLLLTVLLSGCGGSVAPNSVHNADDMDGKKIGVQLGTTGDIFASDVEGASVERYSKGADAVLALKQGKIDCVLIDNEPAKAYVASNSDLTILDDPFEQEEYVVVMQKGNTELKDAIDAALTEIVDNGTMNNIIANYIGENAGKTPYTSPADVSRGNGTLVMATNAEFPPYEYIESDKIVGLDVDMARAVCDKLGKELKIEDMAFDSVLTAVEGGSADVGIAAMSATAERAESVDFSIPYTTATQVIIVRKK